MSEDVSDTACIAHATFIFINYNVDLCLVFLDVIVIGCSHFN